jgi:serine/threonine protein kinase
MDFGTGRELDDNSSSDLTGTPLYLAPEIFAGKPATIQSDIYSLGVLLYHLVTGSYPVPGRTIREVRQGHEQGDHLRNAVKLQGHKTDDWKLPLAHSQFFFEAAVEDVIT